MATVTRGIRINSHVEAVADVITDPVAFFAVIGGIGQFEQIAINDDGSQDWDMFLCVAAVDVGGRARVSSPTPFRLQWSAIRGIEQHALVDAEEVDGVTVVRLTMTVEFAGLITGWLTGLVAADIVARHIDAVLETLRHHIEYGALEESEC